jgi:hypothetical protein
MCSGLERGGSRVTAELGRGAVGASNLWRRTFRRGDAGGTLGGVEAVGKAGRGMVNYGFFL